MDPLQITANLGITVEEYVHWCLRGIVGGKINGRRTWRHLAYYADDLCATGISLPPEAWWQALQHTPTSSIGTALMVTLRLSPAVGVRYARERPHALAEIPWVDVLNTLSAPQLRQVIRVAIDAGCALHLAAARGRTARHLFREIMQDVSSPQCREVVPLLFSHLTEWGIDSTAAQKVMAAACAALPWECVISGFVLTDPRPSVTVYASAARELLQHISLPETPHAHDPEKYYDLRRFIWQIRAELQDPLVYAEMAEHAAVIARLLTPETRKIFTDVLWRALRGTPAHPDADKIVEDLLLVLPHWDDPVFHLVIALHGGAQSLSFLKELSSAKTT